MTLDPYLRIDRKINSNQIRDLNVKPKARKVLEETTEKCLDISTGDIFVSFSSKAQTTKAKINTWRVTLNIFHIANGTEQTSDLLSGKNRHSPII